MKHKVFPVLGPLSERVMCRIEKAEDGCWNWIGSVGTHGYGRMTLPNNGDWRQGGHQIMAHRVSYEAFIGPIPDGLTLDHLCRNKRCVNPEHLEPVTLRENILRSDSFSARGSRMSRDKHAVVDTAADVRRGNAALDFRESRANVHRRIGWGEAPVLCHVCGTETDVETPAHAPSCPLTPAPAVKPPREPQKRYRGRGGQMMFSRAVSTDGSKTQSEMTREQEAWEDEQPITVRCAVCGWSLATTAARGRDAARKHRERKHPELSGKRRKTHVAAHAEAKARAEARAALSERAGTAQPAQPARSESAAKRGRPVKWTRAAIIATLQANPDETSHSQGRDGMPTAQACIREFGSWSAARAAAGLPPSGRARAVDTSAASLANGSHSVRPATPEELVRVLMGRLIA